MGLYLTDAARDHSVMSISGMRQVQKFPWGASTSLNDYYSSLKEFALQNVYTKQVDNAYFPQ